MGDQWEVINYTDSNEGWAACVMGVEAALHTEGMSLSNIDVNFVRKPINLKLVKNTLFFVNNNKTIKDI